jgi:hypothetical protein
MARGTPANPATLVEEQVAATLVPDQVGPGRVLGALLAGLAGDAASRLRQKLQPLG